MQHRDRYYHMATRQNSLQKMDYKSLTNCYYLDHHTTLGRSQHPIFQSLRFCRYSPCKIHSDNVSYPTVRTLFVLFFLLQKNPNYKRLWTTFVMQMTHVAVLPQTLHQWCQLPIGLSLIHIQMCIRDSFNAVDMFNVILYYD